ncbi:MAG: pyruvate carboxylase, partial [Bacteroidota bacterium]
MNPSAPTPIRSLLIANRGEIALRVLRAASELGLRTVAIFTYEDRYSLHRYKADEAYQIGEDDQPLKPYLDVEEILRVAKTNRVDAIHPGYGFLSENVRFARRCREEGIVFVGPEPEVMEQVGDKVMAKQAAAKVGVPMIPDSQQPLDSEEIVLSEARRIGFPVMVKAASGGGGRGMRVVRSEADLASAWKEASGEAKTAFGDGTVFLEKFIENPKHIEVQILGDKHGNIVHLFERDCSVQRRFQKVVEIAPALSLSQAAKEKLYDYALRLCRHVGYTHAGTVEFLVDNQQNIFFIEVNPRIQVEHTVTEEITGIDLVRAQILIAQGAALSDPSLRIYSQASVTQEGFAIQCRITTEDPTANFKPDYGTLIAYRPAGGFGIRLDEGSAYAGATISPFFDSMLVKVTAWGRTFTGAADRLLRSLNEFRIRGVKTNIGFLENLLRHETFRKGDCTVGFIGENPELFDLPRRQDRGTKVLKYLGEIIVNGNPDVHFVDEKKNRLFRHPHVPTFNPGEPFPKGTRDRLLELGAAGFCEWLKNELRIQYTDTTFRDAHQSLLATRVRTYDLTRAAESYARRHGSQVFSVEMWGGATFDVALRFLKESPWRRLESLRKRMPNILFQMLLRGSNGVGYKAYPDNLIEAFIEHSWKKGIDIFRIFDSFNNIESMQTSIRAVLERTDGKGIAEACVCYTGDIQNPDRQKFNLQYYIDMA